MGDIIHQVLISATNFGSSCNFSRREVYLLLWHDWYW